MMVVFEAFFDKVHVEDGCIAGTVSSSNPSHHELADQIL